MKKIITCFCLSILFVPILAMAQDTGSIIPTGDATVGGSIGSVATMSEQPIDQTLNTIANYVIGILVIVAVFYIIWAGYTFVAHGTDPDAVAKARQRIMFAGIGIIVALLAKGIVGLVLNAMGSGNAGS